VPVLSVLAANHSAALSAGQRYEYSSSVKVSGRSRLSHSPTHPSVARVGKETTSRTAPDFLEQAREINGERQGALRQVGKDTSLISFFFFYFVSFISFIFYPYIIICHFLYCDILLLG